MNLLQAQIIGRFTETAIVRRLSITRSWIRFNWAATSCFGCITDYWTKWNKNNLSIERPDEYKQKSK